MALNLNIDADALDLMSLGNNAPVKVADSGKPTIFSIDDVIEDPTQPRKKFDPVALQRLANQVKLKGVKSPISVRPANVDGKHIVNHGARRLRASIMAGLKTIPGFIDETHDKYDQVAENMLRDDLAPMELALFVHERVTAGDKKSDIAARLGQESQSFISELLPLVKAPKFIQDLGWTKALGAKTLYVLCKAYEKKPAEIEAYIATTEEITRPGIQAVLDGSKAPQTDLTAPGDVSEGRPAADPVAVVEQPTGGDLGVSANGTPAPPKAAPAGDVPAQQSAPSPAAGQPVVIDAEAAPAVAVSPKPGKAPGASLPPRQLSITVKVDGRIAMLKQAGKITVTFEETGETKELDFATVEIVGTKSV